MYTRRFRPRRQSTYRRYNQKPRDSGFIDKAGKAIALAGTALAVARGVKSLLNVEYKHHDTSNTGTADTTGVVNPLSYLAQGDDYDDRNGRSVKSVRLNVKGQLLYNSSGLTIQRIRILVIMDMEGAGGVPAITDVLTTADMNSWRNLDNTDRFKVLKDERAIITTQDLAQDMNWNFDIDNHMEYIGTAANAASTGKNSLWMMILGDQASNGVSYTITSRWRYIDN